MLISKTFEVSDSFVKNSGTKKLIAVLVKIKFHATIEKAKLLLRESYI